MSLVKNVTMCIKNNQLEQLYKTDFGSVYQCSSTNCYLLEFGGEWHPLKVSDFLFLKKEVDSIDVVSMINNPCRTADVIILRSYRAKRCFVLTALEILQLRELLSGARFMIDLNSLLNECLNTPVYSLQ